MDTHFTQRQIRLITNAVTSIAFAVLVAIVLAFTYCGYKFVSTYEAILIPPIAALILAKVVQPPFDFLRKFLRKSLPIVFRRRFPKTFAMIVTGLSVFITVGIIIGLTICFFWFCGHLLISQLATISTSLLEFFKNGIDQTPALKAFFDRNGLTPIIKAITSDTTVADWFDPAAVASKAVDYLQAVIRSLPRILDISMGVIMVPIYLAVFLASRPLDGEDLTKVILGFSEKTKENIRFLIDEFIRIIVVFFQAQVLVALVKGILLGLGLQYVAQVNYGMLLGMLAGIVGFIPYMGSVCVMPSICLYALFGADGGLSRLVLTIAVWASVGLADFYVTPKIQGNRIGLSNFTIIFSLFFWGTVVGGFAGLFLAIPLSAFVAVFWRLLKREYFTSPSVPTEKSEEIMHKKES